MLDSKQKISDCCLWLNHKQNRCKWFFFLVLCAELQALEKTVPSKPIYVLYFAILLSAQNPCHSIMYSSLLDIFPAIFPSRLFVPSSINTVDQDLCFVTQGLVLCTENNISPWIKARWPHLRWLQHPTFCTAGFVSERVWWISSLALNFYMCSLLCGCLDDSLVLMQCKSNLSLAAWMLSWM